ncbi:hypothetical protein [Leptolyngbya sp. FACHB-36]|uniref:hypothetical protein n=1 Tax=Leptolyngbya sp. FACHB-36 TaxID=2692808 RepID=UPI0016811E97|nr:hypothetical protein [Leptolyngbya sp. FACHB-36]
MVINFQIDHQSHLSYPIAKEVIALQITASSVEQDAEINSKTILLGIGTGDEVR